MSVKFICDWCGKKAPADINLPGANSWAGRFYDRELDAVRAELAAEKARAEEAEVGLLRERAHRVTIEGGLETADRDLATLRDALVPFARFGESLPPIVVSKARMTDYGPMFTTSVGDLDYVLDYSHFRVALDALASVQPSHKQETLEPGLVASSADNAGSPLAPQEVSKDCGPARDWPGEPSELDPRDSEIRILREALEHIAWKTLGDRDASFSDALRIATSLAQEALASVQAVHK